MLQVALNSNISGDEQGCKRMMADLEGAGLDELVGDLLLRQHRFSDALEAFKKCCSAPRAP